MKIRNSFVSNSSTSSFVLVGWRGKPTASLIRQLFLYFGEDNIQEDDEEIENDLCCYLETIGFDLMNEEDDGADLYGIWLLSIHDDEGVSEINLDANEITSLHKVAKDLKLPKPKLYGGTRMC